MVQEASFACSPPDFLNLDEEDSVHFDTMVLDGNSKAFFDICTLYREEEEEEEEEKEEDDKKNS